MDFLNPLEWTARNRRVGRRALMVSLPLVSVCLCSTLAHATTSTLVIQPSASTTDDAYVREDKTSENRGTDSGLYLRTSGDRADRSNILVRIPLTGLSGKTVLQASLALQQAGDGIATPIEARVYPITESWTESIVTWTLRSQLLVLGTAWSGPGGTHGGAWTDRQFIGSGGIGSFTQWKIGPIVEAWNSGALTNNGLVIEAVRDGSSREILFNSSDKSGGSSRPALIIQYTDSPPAIASGVAEIQPRAIHTGATDAALTAWLDVNALSNSPSGAATGFDALMLTHKGSMSVTRVERLLVAGTAVPVSQVTWTDDGQTVTFRFPRIRIRGRVEIDFHVNLSASARASAAGLDLPMSVDDSTTPGATAQALWPANADGIAGNGDNWVVTVISTPAVALTLTPAWAEIQNRTCVQLTATLRDASNNSFSLPMDSVAVRPSGMGTVGPDLRFCPTTSGTATVIASYGALRDTSIIDVLPDQLTTISSLSFRTLGGNTATALTPGDTMFVDVGLHDGDGLSDIQSLQFDILHSAALSKAPAAAYGATFHWTSTAGGTWTVSQPASTSWQPVPGLCVFDPTNEQNGGGIARLAFVVGNTARASNAGEWSIRVRANSVTPAGVADTTVAGLDAAARILMFAADAAGDFGAGAPGTSRLSLASPPDAQLHYKVLSNTPFTIEARATDLVGVSNALDTLHIGAPANRLRWSPTANPADGANIVSEWTALETIPAPEDDATRLANLRLWIDYPLPMSQQDYAGSLSVRASISGVPVVAMAPITVPLNASVVSSGLAAQIAIAEILPHDVKAGTPIQSMTAFLQPLPHTGDTGIDRIRVGIPTGYGMPTVTQVRVAGAAAPFTDLSVDGLAEVTLGNKVTLGQLIELQWELSTPSSLDAVGAAFVVGYDDQTTPISPQTAVEGDANGTPDGNNWLVRVVAGDLARVAITPARASVIQGQDTTFAATGMDALGHVLTVSPAWRVEGAVGSIGSASGAFTATNMGRGSVIAQSGAFSDTAEVTVTPLPGITLRSVRGPAIVVQGETAGPFNVQLTNAAAEPVRIDSLTIHFGRAVAGDADADFVRSTGATLPVVIPAGGSMSYGFTVDVGINAVAAPLSVQASAAGVDTATGARYFDNSADTACAVTVVPGGIAWTATQAVATVRPGTLNAALMSLHVENKYPATRTLQAITLKNVTIGSGDREALDAELGAVLLYRDDGNGVFDPGHDTLVLQSAAFNGTIVFTPTDVDLAPLSITTLFVSSNAPLSVREGDVIDVSLASPTDVSITPQSSSRNAWPVTAPGGLTVDGMVAAQVQAYPVGPATLNPGARDRLAFDAVLPANGYATDVLNRLSVGNAGTALPEDDIQRLRAWVDDGDGVFSKTADALLGTLAYTGGGRWQLTGLTRAVPLGGARLFVTVDAASLAAQNATIKLFLPASPDPGVGMASGNSGPLDVAVMNPSSLILTDADRVALGAIPLAGGSGQPGARQLPLLGLVATNTYTAPRTLTTLVFDNMTTGLGSAAERDAEARLLTLRADGNQNGVLEGTDVDPVLSTGFFQNGQATFTGLAVALPAGASRGLFLTADLSTTAARDGDMIAAQLTNAEGIDFNEATSIAGNWPLDSGARWTIDGMTAAQLANFGAPGATVGPGDGPLLALDLLIPRNGYANDLLRGIRVTNLGTAGVSDLSLVQLWHDGGDGKFTGSGDDVLLGPLAYSGNEWTSPLLSTAVGGTGLRIFVSVNIAAAAAETTTVRFAIPVGGIEYESTNDGPLDAPVANADDILITSSPLLASMFVPRASTVGQTVAVRMMVRNTSNETVTNVTPGSLNVEGTAPFTALSGPTPAVFDIAPASVDTIVWLYRADGVGDVRFADVAGGTGSPSNLPRNAPRATSNGHRVYLGAQQLDLTPVQTMPIRVNRGQSGVVPFSLTLVHPGGIDASDVRIDHLRIRLEEESGAPIVPSALLDRVEVNEGTNVYLVKSSIETTGSEVDLQLATPVTVTGTQPATISLRLALGASTVIPTFRVIFDDSTSIGAQDATSGSPVTVRLEGSSYPLRSDVTSIVAEATELQVTALGPDTVRTSPGRAEALLMRLRLMSPGITGISSNVRVTSISMALTDSSGADLASPGLAFGEVRLKSGGQVVGRRVLAPGDGDSITFTFAPPIEAAANTPFDLAIVGDVGAGARLGRYGARLLDSTRVDARDVNTRSRIPARYPTPVVRGGCVVVEGTADTLFARDHSQLPATIVIGESDVVAIAATLRHPGGPGEARVRVDGLTVQLLDDLRRPLVPRGIIGRLRLQWNGIDQADVSLLPGTGDRVPLALPGLLLEPGDTAHIEVRIDIDAAAPFGFVEFVVPPDGWVIRDANTDLAVTLAAESATALPLHSGIGRLTSPARDLAVGLTSLMPASLASDGRAVDVARMTFRNTDEQGVGPIAIAHLVARCGDRLNATQPLGVVATRLEAWCNGTLWASSAALTPDSVSAVLDAAQRLTVAPGATATVDIRMITRDGAQAAGVRLGFDRGGIGVVQPASALLSIDVGAEPGQAFPLWTQTGVLANATLENSYVNFPNPFAAGREATTLAYYMPAPGRVTLRVLTARGDLVTTLLDGAERGAGQQLVDRWNGRNGRGDAVVNGVYVAELDIRFDDGASRQLRRKLAVVR